MQIWGLARSFNVTIRPFHLKEEQRWAPDLEELKKHISPRTKMIAVCNPNNPTGAVLGQEEMEEIVRIAKKTNAWLYSDEVYRGAELNHEETHSFWGLYEKVIITGGLSKAYGLPGLRIGWLVGPKPTIEKLWSYHDYTTISTGILSNRVATWALQPGMRKDILSRSRNILNENVNILTEWVERRSNLFQFIPPRAGGVVSLRCTMKMSSAELTDKLRKEKSVFIAPGECFGMDHYLRIGIGSESDYFSAALNLFDEMLHEMEF